MTTSNLERVRKVKTRHQRLYARVQTIREELQRFLEDDEDMMKMCLTRKKELEFAAGQPPLSAASRSLFRTPSGRHHPRMELCLQAAEATAPCRRWAAWAIGGRASQSQCRRRAKAHRFKRRALPLGRVLTAAILEVGTPLMAASLSARPPPQSAPDSAVSLHQ